MTFTTGPHACIGFRFAIVEAKALLFTLIRAFEFKLAVPLEDIGKRAFVAQRPYLKKEKEKGVQLPLLVKQTGDM